MQLINEQNTNVTDSLFLQYYPKEELLSESSSSQTNISTYMDCSYKMVWKRLHHVDFFIFFQLPRLPDKTFVSFIIHTIFLILLFLIFSNVISNIIFCQSYPIPATFPTRPQQAATFPIASTFLPLNFWMKVALIALANCTNGILNTTKVLWPLYSLFF